MSTANGCSLLTCCSVMKGSKTLIINLREDISRACAYHSSNQKMRSRLKRMGGGGSFEKSCSARATKGCDRALLILVEFATEVACGCCGFRGNGAAAVCRSWCLTHTGGCCAAVCAVLTAVSLMPEEGLCLFFFNSFCVLMTAFRHP